MLREQKIKMKDLIKLMDRLNKEGYKTYITNIDEKEYLKGGYIGDDFEKSLLVEIWIYMEDNKYVFIDIDKQSAENKHFKSENEVFNFIKNKFPI